MKFCKVADFMDWQHPDFQATANLLRMGAKDRKTWEFIQVYNGLNHLGLLNNESRILGLGVGHECLIYAFTNLCQQVVATDLYESHLWATASMSVEAVYNRNPFPYQRDRLIVQHMDMTTIAYPDESFDAVWSCCAIEHVHNFRELHQVYQEIHRVLKPGGIAALTTEFNPTDFPSYEPNLLFTDRDWMQQWLTGPDPLVQGFELLDPLDFSIAAIPENAPKPRKYSGSTIQIYCNDIVLNSVSFFLRKTGSFARSYDENWLAPFWSNYLSACDHYRSKNFTQSETILEQILRHDLEPRLKVRAARRLADALFAQNKEVELQQVCRSILPACEQFEDSDQFIPLGHHCWKVGLLDEAYEFYRRSETLPGSSLDSVIRSLLHQAKYFEVEGRYSDALTCLDRAEQAILPNTNTDHYRSRINFRRGLSHEKMDKLERAAHFYRLAIKTAEPGSDLYNNCYRRLTICLQSRVKQLKEKLQDAEAAKAEIQTSKFRKILRKLAAMRKRLS